MGDVISIILGLLTIVGTWKLFTKFGKKGWYALIPFYDEYVMAHCARRENEAVKLMIFKGIYELTSIVGTVLISMYGEDSEAASYALIATIILFVPYFIYSVRIFLALCDVFGRSRKWALLWVFVSALPAMVWGFSSKFQPISEEEIAAREGGSVDTADLHLAGLGEGLSIDITDRTVKNLFKSKTLLRDIHMKIQPGHMVLLLGGSGAGKTTFLNAVTGYEKANAVIQLDKGDLYKNYKDMKYDVGFVPQQDLMRGSDTVYRTIADAAALRLPKGLTSEEKKQKIDETLDLFGLGMLKSSLVDKLSGGQRKRLSIAMEFISDPKLFILDEPDSGLDGVVARSLFKELRDIADSGKIVMVITHTPDRVIDLFDDVIVLAKDSDRTGRLTYFGPIKEAYEFFGKESMEGILLAINQKEEGGEGRAEELLQSYEALVKEREAGGEAS